MAYSTPAMAGWSHPAIVSTRKLQKDPSEASSINKPL
jgi:hypothetical protein